MPAPGLTDGQIVRNGNYSESGFVVSGDIHATSTGKTPTPTNTYKIKYHLFRIWSWDYVQTIHHPHTDPTVNGESENISPQLIGVTYGTVDYPQNTTFSSTSANQSAAFDFAAEFATLHPDDTVDPNHDYATYSLTSVAYKYGLDVDIVTGTPETNQVPELSTSEANWSELPPS